MMLLHVICVCVWLSIIIHRTWHKAESEQWDFEKQQRHAMCKDMIREYRLRELKQRKRRHVENIGKHDVILK